jgi:hypothetical protein
MRLACLYLSSRPDPLTPLRAIRPRDDMDFDRARDCNSVLSIHNELHHARLADYFCEFFPGPLELYLNSTPDHPANAVPVRDIPDMIRNKLRLAKDIAMAIQL